MGPVYIFCFCDQTLTSLLTVLNVTSVPRFSSDLVRANLHYNTASRSLVEGISEAFVNSLNRIVCKHKSTF